MNLNDIWVEKIKKLGADFVYFVDISGLDKKVIEDYKVAILFGKALSQEYIQNIHGDVLPKHKEIFNTEQKMDTLALKVANLLNDEGYKSVGKLKTGLLPHKTIALRAGLGFIGKNNLLVTPQYGCAVMLGKVLTTAPFATTNKDIINPLCGKCQICVDVCPTKALLNKEWSITTTREEILNRKECILCHKCMAMCPYTEKYFLNN